MWAVSPSSAPSVRSLSLATPDLLDRLDDEPELGGLLLGGQVISLHGRREPALRRETDLVDVDEPCRLLDAPLQLVLRLELTGLGGDEPEHDDLPLGQEPKRLEAARSLVVELDEEPVDVQPAEERLTDEVVAPLGRPGRAVVAAAHVGGDRHSRRLVGDYLVEPLDEQEMEVIGIVAARSDLRPLSGIVDR